MKKKLVYILNHYSHNSEQHFFHVLNLLEEMAESGIQIALVIEKCDDAPKIKHSNITVYGQKKKSKAGRVYELFRLLLKLQQDGYQKVFIRISWVAACVAIVAGFVKKLETYYWLSGQGGAEQYQNTNWGISKFKLFFSSRIPFWFIKTFIYRFVTGPESMADYMSSVMKVSQKKILILYNDIDISRFSLATESKKIECKKQFKLPTDKKIILFVHRLSPVRKTLFYIPFIISEFYNTKSTSEFHFAFVGKGPEENELKNAIKKAGINENITLLGAIPNSEIAQLYQSADLFINPTYAEGFPRVLIEAMACGLPIVTTDAGGICDILGSFQKKYMIDKNDRITFSQKLIALSTDMKEQHKLNEENLIQVKRFSTQAVAKMYINRMGLSDE